MMQNTRSPSTPKAWLRSDGKTWEAKGLNSTTGKQRSVYAKSAEEASAKAAATFRLHDTDTLTSYYFNSYVPTLRGRSAKWQEQVAWAMERFVLPDHGESAI